MDEQRGWGSGPGRLCPEGGRASAAHSASEHSASEHSVITPSGDLCASSEMRSPTAHCVSPGTADEGATAAGALPSEQPPAAEKGWSGPASPAHPGPGRSATDRLPAHRLHISYFPNFTALQGRAVSRPRGTGPQIPGSPGARAGQPPEHTHLSVGSTVTGPGLIRSKTHFFFTF